MLPKIREFFSGFPGRVSGWIVNLPEWAVTVIGVTATLGVLGLLISAFADPAYVTSMALQGVFKLILIGCGVLMARGTLIWMDRSSIGRPFMKKLERWDEKNQALYYGLRLLGVFLLAGLVLS